MRIQDLDQITNETIDLSQHLAIDDPSQSFKMTLLQLRDFFVGQLYPVGSTMIRMDNKTPSECGFPGTWGKMQADRALHTADADGSNVNTVVGNSFPTVPVPEHTHSAAQESHTHAATQVAHTHTADQAAHTHTVTINSAGDHQHVQAENYQRGYKFGLSGEDLATNEVYDNGKGGDASLPYTKSAGAHTHTTSVTSTDSAITVGNATPAITVPSAAPVITVEKTGTALVTMDTRGARILVNIWHRTA